MKLIHISDLHIGKRIYEFSMLDEQIYILDRIVRIASENEVGAVLISGDVYDRSIPAVEAVDVFDDFVTALAELGVYVFIIAGNHDSPERLDFGSRILRKHNVYIVGTCNKGTSGNGNGGDSGNEHRTRGVYEDSGNENRMQGIDNESDNENRMQGIDNESDNENRMQGIDNESGNENRMHGIDNESDNENRMHGIDNESGNENRLSEVGGETVRAIPMATLHDEYGALNIWLMPYMKSTCAIETLAAANVNQDERNILLAHQYVANGDALPAPSESESRFSVGGIDRIDVALFDAFDYVALGHIHGPQWIGRHTVRYCGSPLKYSFSECEQEKSVVIVDAREKGKLCYKKEPLPPRRDLVEIRCALSELGAQAADQDAFAHITLTDENMIIDAIGKVREVYPNTMLLDYDNLRSRAENTENTLSGEDVREKTPLELFDGFFELQNGASLNDTQRALFTDVTGGDTDEA